MQLGFASVKGHPIWIGVMNAVTEAIFQELQEQLDGTLDNTVYKPKVGKAHVLCMMKYVRHIHSCQELLQK